MKKIIGLLIVMSFDSVMAKDILYCVGDNISVEYTAGELNLLDSIPTGKGLIPAGKYSTHMHGQYLTTRNLEGSTVELQNSGVRYYLRMSSFRNVNEFQSILKLYSYSGEMTVQMQEPVYCQRLESF